MSAEQREPFVFEQVIHDDDGQAKELAMRMDNLLPLPRLCMDDFSGMRSAGEVRIRPIRTVGVPIFEPTRIVEAVDGPNATRATTSIVARIAGSPKICQ